MQAALRVGLFICNVPFWHAMAAACWEDEVEIKQENEVPEVCSIKGSITRLLQVAPGRLQLKKVPPLHFRPRESSNMPPYPQYDLRRISASTEHFTPEYPNKSNNYRRKVSKVASCESASRARPHRGERGHLLQKDLPTQKNEGKASWLKENTSRTCTAVQTKSLQSHYIIYLKP